MNQRARRNLGTAISLVAGCFGAASMAIDGPNPILLVIFITLWIGGHRLMGR